MSITSFSFNWIADQKDDLLWDLVTHCVFGFIFGLVAGCQSCPLWNCLSGWLYLWSSVELIGWLSVSSSLELSGCNLSVYLWDLLAAVSG